VTCCVEVNELLYSHLGVANSAKSIIN